MGGIKGEFFVLFLNKKSFLTTQQMHKAQLYFFISNAYFEDKKIALK